MSFVCITSSTTIPGVYSVFLWRLFVTHGLAAAFPADSFVPIILLVDGLIVVVTFLFPSAYGLVVACLDLLLLGPLSYRHKILSLLSR